MLIVRLAGGHLCGKWLFTWLSLVMFWWRLFVLSFFPRDVWNETWDLIGSVFGGFPAYFFIGHHQSAKLVSFRCPPARLRHHTIFADESYGVGRMGHHLGCTLT